MHRQQKRKRELQEREDADVEKELKKADEIADEQLIKPSGSEKSALSAFCTYSLQCKQAEAEAKAVLKNIKPKIKELRLGLLDALGESSVLRLSLIPNDDSAPKYLRLTKNTKDLTITSDVLKEAFQRLKEAPEDIKECEQDDVIDAIAEVLISNVRRLVRSYQEQAKLTDSLPRGIKAADVPQANSEISRAAFELHKKGSFVLETERKKREKMSLAKAEMAKREPSVDAFFVRANMSSQRVTLENAPYNLCRRTSLIKPKISFKLLEQVIKEELAQFNDLKVGKDEFLQHHKQKMADIEQCVVTKLSTLPSSVKTVIHLQKLGIK